jgi:hypothetical protein
MPSRFVTLAIVAFWLATTGWLIYREMLPPLLQTNEPPPFTIDLADEVSANAISWRVLQKDEEIGTIRTAVRRLPNRLFALEGTFKPQNLLFPGLEIKKIRSVYVVTRDGDLRALEVKANVVLGIFPMDVSVDGKVEDGIFAPAIRIEGLAMKDPRLPKLDPVEVAGHGSVLNPLHPLNRLGGLRDGQRWLQPVIDPLLVVIYSASPLNLQPPVRRLTAEVEPGVLVWHGEEVPCWKIGYREAGQKESARTWVRRSDGLVLQQEANQGGMELVLQRNSTR